MTVFNNLNYWNWLKPSILSKNRLNLRTCAVIAFLSSLPFTSILTSLSFAAICGAAYWSAKTVVLRQHKKSDFLRRLPSQDWQAIQKTIQTLDHEVTEQELRSFREGRWDHPIFQIRNWTYIAFSSFLDGYLDQDTMCKLFLYQASQKHSREHRTGFVALQLFREDGSLNREVAQSLRAATANYLADEEFERLLNEFEKTPPHRSQFFLVERSDKDLLFQGIMGNEQYQSLNEHLLSFYEDRSDFMTGRLEQIPWQAVASPEFVYQIHRARFGENAIRPAPVLGYFRVENLSNPTHRVVTIPAFDFPRPELHGTPCQELSAYHHDIALHHAIESANMHRPVWIAFAKFLKEKGMKWVLPHLLDRDLGNYLVDRKPFAPDNFWIGLDLFYRFILGTTSGEQQAEFKKKCIP